MSSTTSSILQGGVSSYAGSNARLDMEIVPSLSVGPFTLGMAIGDLISHFRRRKNQIPKVEFKYSDSAPLDYDLVFNLPANGIALRVDPKTQRLRNIELYDFSKLRLIYENTEFISHKTLPTFVLIYKTFGPTYPGWYEEDNQRYVLNYEGISFMFPVPTKYADMFAGNPDLPLTFPDATTPVLNRILIYHGTQWQTSNPPALGQNDLYLENVYVEPCKGLTFMSRVANITFGMSAQDVLAELGKPNYASYRRDDAMRIHTAPRDESRSEGTAAEGYWWNYVSLGVDVLFDGYSHTVKKFMHHTNFPGHPDFNRYRRCNFSIVLPSGEGRIDALSKWDNIKSLLGNPSGPPVIFNSMVQHRNPFGSTSFYGYSELGLIFEVCN
ncbi:hypothetical protein BJ742DRAFT_821391 [Cladochytrium replicatum]|nr:hypothetical protein BJ742DRAFT_821391 [Cladochytrium replicatum]